MQVDEVVRLEQHIAELGVAEPVFRFEAALDRVFRHHDVHRETLPDDAEEVEVAKFFHPVEIIDQNRAVFLIVKVDEARHLLLDAVDVVLNRFRRQKFAFVAFAARVADHSGRAADENDRTVPGFLEAAKVHNRDQVPDVQRVRRRVETAVNGSRLFEEKRAELFVGDLVQQAAPSHLVDDVEINGHWGSFNG